MKLKKGMMILCFFMILMFATGCGEGTSKSASAQGAGNVADVLQERIDEAEGNTEPETETESSAQSSSFFYTGEEEETGDIYSTEGVDMDLTQLSGTLLYATVNNMMYKPEDYLGKVVMVPGNFSAVYSEEMDKYYFGCLISDQTACCTLGVEFELPDDYVYPDDYPKEGEEITVVGTFDTYEEGPYTYCVLRGAKLAS